MSLNPLPQRRYSKTDLCYLLVDPTTNLDNPGDAERISCLTLMRYVKRKPGLLDKLNLTLEEYRRKKYFTITEGVILIQELG